MAPSSPWKGTVDVEDADAVDVVDADDPEEGASHGAGVVAGRTGMLVTGNAASSEATSASRSRPSASTRAISYARFVSCCASGISSPLAVS